MASIKKNRVVLITGASRGIGLSVANTLSDEGYCVIGTSRSGVYPQKATFDCMLPLNVSLDQSVEACVQEVFHQFGRIDALVNNAAYPLDGPTEAATLDQVKAQFEVNFYGALRMMKAVLPAMRQQVGGIIINVSSGVVELGFPFMPYYTASKCALEGVSRVARQELKPFGISVCVVQPGFTKTEIDTAIVTGEDSNELYEPRCTAWMEAYRKAIRAGQDPSAVAHCISRILSNPKPGFLYFAGAEVRIGGLLKKLLPEDLFYWALRRIYRVHV